jgi:hypothetical protein
MKFLLGISICNINVVASQINLTTFSMVFYSLKVYFMKGWERHNSFPLRAIMTSSSKLSS